MERLSVRLETRLVVMCWVLVCHLFLSSCQNKAEEARSADTTNVVEMNATADMETANDNMTAQDAANGAANMAADANAMNSSGRTPDETSVWCDVLSDSVPAAECRRVNELKSRLPTGGGAISGPARMRKGDTAIFSLAVSRAGSGEASQVLGRDPKTSDKDEELTETGPFKVGRYVSAELHGPGFKVEPSGDVIKDLYASGEARWDWNVTAQRSEKQRLVVTVKVLVGDPHQGGNAIALKTFERDVTVTVGTAERVNEDIKTAEPLISTSTRVLEALGLLVAAAGGLWLAIRTFGKGKPPKPD